VDDPIFDPWCLGDDGWPTPSQRTSRWRGAARDQSGVPLQRPIPGKRPGDTAEADDFIEGLGPDLPARQPEPPSEPDPTSAAAEEILGVDDLAPVDEVVEVDDPTPVDEPIDPNEPLGFRAPARPPRPRSEPEGPSLIELTDRLQRGTRTGSGGDPVHEDEDRPTPPPPAREPARPQAAAPRGTRRTKPEVGDTSLLRSLLLPRLDRLGQRLAAERHRTTVDERLGHDPPSVRFRIDPRPGPFDLDERRGAVLEVVQEGGPDGVVAGKLWLDPMSSGPSERRGVPADEANGTWLDGLLLDFVRKALR
jgi:hypothetical protein